MPSSLNSFCVQYGKVNEEILKSSMDLEIDVCISRVDKCPCAFKNGYQFVQGCLQHERVAVKTFIKGTRKEKELLKSEDSELCVKIKSVWELRKMHVI